MTKTTGNLTKLRPHWARQLVIPVMALAIASYGPHGITTEAWAETKLPQQSQKAKKDSQKTVSSTPKTKKSASIRPIAPPRKPLQQAQAFDDAAAGRWDRVEKAIAAEPNTPQAKVLTWMRLKSPQSGANYDSIRHFINTNPAWPDRTTLRRRAEEAIWTTADDKERQQWFASGRALTREGWIWIAESTERSGNLPEAARQYRRIWREEIFTSNQEDDFLKRHGRALEASDHLARLDYVLWKHRFAEARRMLDRVPANIRSLADARMDFATQQSNAENALSRVSKELRNDPGLVYEYARWLRRKNRDQDAITVLLQYAGERPYPELWWDEHAILARDALAEGWVTQAYQLASKHNLKSASEVADAEWLAGWIAFQFLKDDMVAQDHFQRLYQVVSTPVSKARGAYWLGRTQERRGDAEVARTWFSRAADHHTAFYGQLASVKTQTNLPKFQDAPPSPKAITWVKQHELMTIIIMLNNANQDRLFTTFARALYRAAPSDDARLAVVHEISRLSIAQGVRLSRLLRQDNVTETRLSYPIPKWIDIPSDPNPALVLAVIRQESNFDTEATSSAGARGLMQVMPKTAAHEAKIMNRPFSIGSLTDRPNVNVAIGSHYLSRLLQRYDGHPALALAAYNAGERRVDQWLKLNGDPRLNDVDDITWIESIPFRETRNYVQRVLENAAIYDRIVLRPAKKVAAEP